MSPWIARYNSYDYGDRSIKSPLKVLLFYSFRINELLPVQDPQGS
jgi:hypothetical protein